MAASLHEIMGMLKRVAPRVIHTQNSIIKIRVYIFPVIFHLCVSNISLANHLVDEVTPLKNLKT